VWRNSPKGPKLSRRKVGRKKEKTLQEEEKMMKRSEDEEENRKGQTIKECVRMETDFSAAQSREGVHPRFWSVLCLLCY